MNAILHQTIDFATSAPLYLWGPFAFSCLLIGAVLLASNMSININFGDDEINAIM